MLGQGLNIFTFINNHHLYFNLEKSLSKSKLENLIKVIHTIVNQKSMIEIFICMTHFKFVHMKCLIQQSFECFIHSPKTHCVFLPDETDISV